MQVKKKKKKKKRKRKDAKQQVNHRKRMIITENPRILAGNIEKKESFNA